MSWDTRVEAIKKKVDDLTPIAKEPCMYKLHEQLLDVNSKAYKPVLLAIGPYNHQEKVRLEFMEKHKLRYLQQMVNETEGSLETYIMDLRESEESARNCYVECISQTPAEFVEMMLIDGCFIIELFLKHEIYLQTGDCQGDPIFEMQWVLPRIARDLLLFENQIPFFILEKLLKMMSERKRHRNFGEHTVDMIQDKLNDLALGFFSAYLPFQWNVDVPSYNSTSRIRDLLCLVHEASNPIQAILTEFVRKNSGKYLKPSL